MNNIFSQEKVNNVVGFLGELKHTKGIFHGKPFILLPWQHEIVTDLYGTLRHNGYRQYKKCYIELPKKQGKSELLSGLGLYHLCADGEWCAEVYGCAADKGQASIIFDVAVEMVDQHPDLKKVIKPILSVKRLVYLPTKSFYQVLSAEAYSKHGLNVSCCLFDEIHAQPSRELYDVMVHGSGDARMQPMYFFITTAGNDPDRQSIGWEVHKKAENILLGRSNDKITYPAIWGIDIDENRIWTGKKYIKQDDKIDWKNKLLWKQVNPSLGETIRDDVLIETFDEIKGNDAEEKLFKQLRLNIWVKEKYTNWVTIEKWNKNSGIIDLESLKGKSCYGGLDLSRKLDITAFVLIFLPDDNINKYTIVPTFWLPEDNLSEIIKRDKIKYNEWVDKGLIKLTKGNKIDYHAIVNEILRLRSIFEILEIGYDVWNADAVATDLDDAGIDMIEIRQNYQTLSPIMNDLEALIHAGLLNKGNNEVLDWNFSNLQVKMDDNGNIKPAKSIKSGSMNKKGVQKAKIDGIVAMLNGFCRALSDEDNDYTIHVI